jgi:hypothetical protein
VTAQAEHVRNFAVDKIFRDDLGALHPRHLFPPVVTQCRRITCRCGIF